MFSMRYDHCQEPRNSYDTLFLPCHSPLTWAGLSSAPNRQVAHDKNSRAAVTIHGPRPFAVQRRHAHSHREHYRLHEGEVDREKASPCRLGLGSQTHGMEPTFTYTRLATSVVYPIKSIGSTNIFEASSLRDGAKPIATTLNIQTSLNS